MIVLFFQNIKKKWYYPSNYPIQEPEWLWRHHYSFFQTLKTSAASLTLAASATSMASTASKALFPQRKFLILMVWSSMAPKWPILVIFCRMDNQKSNFSLIYGALSDGGCWGQPMLLFQKLVDETQMPKPQKLTDTFILTKKLFLLGLRGLQSISNPVERPCTGCIWKKIANNSIFSYWSAFL